MARKLTNNICLNNAEATSRHWEVNKKNHNVLIVVIGHLKPNHVIS
jgi:hypothetical protein